MRTSRRSCSSSAWPNHPTSTVACSPWSHSSALSRLFSFTRIFTKVSRFRGASQGATRGRRQATPGDTPGQFVQLEASWSDAKRRPATPSKVPSKQRVAGSNPAGRARSDRARRRRPRSSCARQQLTGAQGRPTAAVEHTAARASYGWSEPNLDASLPAAPLGTHTRLRFMAAGCIWCGRDRDSCGCGCG